jgi:phosphomannomutase
LTAEEASCVLLESFAGEAAGQVFVGDIRFSRCVAERARQLAARPVSEHGSASAIRARMTAEGAIFGATTGGHYFFRALEGGDDALFAACWMIAWLGASGKSLSQLRRACRPAFITPELRVCVDPSQAAAILRQIHDSWSSGLKTLGDALAIDFPEGWALVEGEAGRSPLLFRFEASDWAALRNLVRHFCGVLGSVGDELWRQYTAALGHPGDGG